MSAKVYTEKGRSVSAQSFKDVDGLTITVDVTNTGRIAGKEIVQVYVHDQKSGLARPPKELKGFAKVELEPGETKTVKLVEIAGKKVIRGGNNLANGKVSAAGKKIALKRVKAGGFAHQDG